MAYSVADPIRCAIYTRKSTAYGLTQDVNSLRVQREVCEAYLRCQEHRNWILLPKHYDDGAQSGGSLDRPALQNLITDIENGLVDVVIIYKIDRLTRSLTDFVRLLDLFAQNGASFVSVTQTFDTSDSMGRLVLNILLTFAQFERELIAERVRDKKAAMLRDGRFVGGIAPFGYLHDSGRLVPDPERAAYVCELFTRYPTENLHSICHDFQQRNVRIRPFTSRSGRKSEGNLVRYSYLARIIDRSIYAGRFQHRGEWIDAKVEPLITFEQWETAQRVKEERRPAPRDPSQFLLLNLLYDDHGRKMKAKAFGLGHACGARYYRSEYAGWARSGRGPRRSMVEAGRAEDMAVGGLISLMTNRATLREAALRCGRYSGQISRALRRGNVAANRIRQMDRTQLRKLLVALVARIDLSESMLTVCLYSDVLQELLLLDRVAPIDGLLKLRPEKERAAIYSLQVPALMLCGRRIYSLGIQKCAAGETFPDRYLSELLDEARDLHDLVMTRRNTTVATLARARNMSSGYFNRLLRLNYLAPDIQTAIIDGTQPPEVTRQRLLFDPLPLDWGQQRELLGFR